MNLRDFRTGWRLLRKEPGYSTAVILGLAVGFAVCVLLLGYVRYCFSAGPAVGVVGDGIPLAWLATERYPSGFVERAPMGALPQLAAALRS